MAKENNAAAGSRPLIITRLVDAPVALVFKAWSDPALVMKWWGPGGFTAPTIKIDFRVGGKYHFCMKSSDGQEFWSTGNYKEIVPLKRIVWSDSFADEKGNVVPASHYGIPGEFPLETEVTVLFEVVGNRTQLTLQHTGLPSAMGDMTRAGWTESLVKFESSVEGTTGGPDRKELVISRAFNAPRKVVYKALTQAEHLAKWWGPKGFTMDVVKLDLRPGGNFHYGMLAPGGQKMWGKLLYREINAPQKLVFISSFCDERGNIIRHPLSATWPLEVLNFMTLEEQGEKTIMQVRGWPIHETEEERKAFEAAIAGVSQGTNVMYDQLEEHLKQLALQPN